jgi:hypothetical protein
LRRAIPDRHEVIPGDVRAEDEAPHLPDQRLAKAVDAPAAGTVQKVKTVERAAGRAIPVARPFVAAAVGRMELQEAIERTHHLVCDGDATRIVCVAEQRHGEHAGGDPRRPVVGPVPGSGHVQRHPAEVIALVNGDENSRGQFAAGALRQARRNVLQLRSEQIERPGDGNARLAREQIHDWLFDIGQADAALLRGDVGRKAPARLLADGPQRVGRRIQEAPPALDALREDQSA